MTEYTTERGITIQVVPIPLLLDKIRAAHPEVEPATYTEHLAGGATQQVVITEQMATEWEKRDPEGWAPHAAGWAAYRAREEERTRVLNDALWRAVMRKALVVTLPQDGGWIVEQATYGITVPDDPAERREHYIWTEVIGGQRDILAIMGLAAGANLTEEQIAAAEASFWNTLERPTARQPAAAERAVAARDEGGADTDGQGMGAAAVRPGPVRRRR